MADRGECLTYGELIERSDRAASLFSSMGVKECNTVAFLLENHIRYPELIWAAKNSGLRYVGDAARTLMRLIPPISWKTAMLRYCGLFGRDFARSPALPLRALPIRRCCC